MTKAQDSGLVAHGISKSFGATRALMSVDFSVRPGEIHALLGENGAGKSTLVKILSGVVKADQGRIELDGSPFEPTPQLSAEVGLVVVHQELSLLPNLTVAENIMLGNIPIHRGFGARMVGHIDRRTMLKRARATLAKMALEIDPEMPVSALSQAERQLVEITRAQAQSPKIILLDEPTSSLPPDQRGALFRRMARIRDGGVGIVFITHSLEEAKLVSDRITVLRDGRNVGTLASSETTVTMLVELMSGRPSGTIFPIWQPDTATASAKLAVQHIASPPKVHDVSFTVGSGEVVGLAGLVGSGRTETMKAIFGSVPIESGAVLVEGKRVSFRSPADAISAGVAFIPEDRQEESLFPNHSVMENICIAAVSSSRDHGVRFGKHVLDRGRMHAAAANLKEALQIKAQSVDSPVTSLSGGNQQKTVLARWMATRPGIILADEPTRGISINNKIEIYKLIRKLAAEGAAIVIASSEFEELVGLCDRIFIIRDGVVDGEIDVTGLTADGLLEAVLSKASTSHRVHVHEH